MLALLRLNMSFYRQVLHVRAGPNNREDLPPALICFYFFLRFVCYDLVTVTVILLVSSHVEDVGRERPRVSTAVLGETETR